jgi:uncharacterized protein
MIARTIQNQVLADLSETKKIVIIYGPRQVGKTTLAKEILKEHGGNVLEINADRSIFTEVLSSRSLSKLRNLVADFDLVFIDEAQRIPDIGINLKILHDEMPQVKILITGSSSLELANQVKESLTGRTLTHRLYPISVHELAKTTHEMELKERIEEYLLYGMYPEVLSLNGALRKQRHLIEIASSYLYKDVLELSSIRHSDKLVKLLKLMALQSGSEVSMHELGKSLGMNHETVAHYIDLLEKGFVLFHLPAFSRNPRKEITKMQKYYFYDTGIRNALIGNFQPLSLRADMGSLWETFLISERLKRNSYLQQFSSHYFWRTYSGIEIDYVEENQGTLTAFEIKWKPKKVAAPNTWLELYPQSTFQSVHLDNFLPFVV